MILVVGATGLLGREITRGLLSRGEDVRGPVRTDEVDREGNAQLLALSDTYDSPIDMSGLISTYGGPPTSRQVFVAGLAPTGRA